MRTLTLVAIFAASASACAEDDDRPATLPYITEAILVPSCTQAECHSNYTQEVGDVFDTVDHSRQTMVFNALALYDTSPADSQIVTVLTTGLPSILNPGDTTLVRMPYDSPIPDEDVKLIEKWVATGAPGGNGPFDAQCVPGPDASKGCTFDGKLVECDDGGAGAVITDCSAEGQICREGACSPE